MTKMISLCHKSKPLAGELGRIMRRERQERNLTLRDVADKAGLQHTQVGKIECAQRDLTVLELIHIAHHTGIDPHYVMTQIQRLYLQSINE